MYVDFCEKRMCDITRPEEVSCDWSTLSGRQELVDLLKSRDFFPVNEETLLSPNPEFVNKKTNTTVTFMCRQFCSSNEHKKCYTVDVRTNGRVEYGGHSNWWLVDPVEREKYRLKVELKEAKKKISDIEAKLAKLEEKGSEN